MSSVRMCDKCGVVFSELEEGWQSIAGTSMMRDRETGEPRQVSVRLDACPRCAITPESVVTSQRSALDRAREDFAHGRITEEELEHRVVDAETRAAPVHAGDTLKS